MKKIVSILVFVLSFILMTGCSNDTTSNKKYSSTLEKTSNTISSTQKQVSYDSENVKKLASYDDYVEKPNEKDEDYYTKLEKWRKYREETRYSIELDSPLDQFINKTMEGILSTSDNENILYSPLNVYLAVSILAETTANESRDELLELLSVESISDLENEAKKIWISVYKNDEETITDLGQSIWLRNDSKYNDNLLEKLKDNYFCSSFSGEMGSSSYNEEFRNWMNEKTRYLLSDQVKELSFEKDTMFTIITTIYYKNSFEEAFNDSFNIDDDFNLINDEKIKVTYMQKSFESRTVYSGDKYTSILIPTTDNGALKIILPNDGYTVNDLLKDEETCDYIRHSDKYAKAKNYHLKVKVPKFDVESKTSLIELLESLGVSKIFNPVESDFSNLVDCDGLVVDKIIHGVRVKVDEEGIEGAAYTFISNKATSIGPGLDSYTFEVNKPFIFAVVNEDDTIIFMGVVYNPVR